MEVGLTMTLNVMTNEHANTPREPELSRRNYVLKLGSQGARFLWTMYLVRRAHMSTKEILKSPKLSRKLSAKVKEPRESQLLKY
ncbi:hypothetical protein FRX31_034695 [Thalictrum thalictroides]|uniref:Uncharacterized protein n=1 Tax=Thalictrum thalictroides TaxID=46969 RepID=A0A7J6UT30_THATH|nr:hypothetical protein FRX31_034695 [Thalictrum thalictroides]